MSYWIGEEIKVFYINGAQETVTVLQCDKGHRGWRLLCRPKTNVATDDRRVIWDCEGRARPERDPVVGVRRTGIVRPVVS